MASMAPERFNLTTQCPNQAHHELSRYSLINLVKITELPNSLTA